MTIKKFFDKEVFKFAESVEEYQEDAFSQDEIQQLISKKM